MGYLPESLQLEFEHPPVVEMALSVAFEPLDELGSAQVALLWDAEFRERFPRIEEHPPVDPSMEDLEGPTRPLGPQMRMMFTPPIPRFWFLNQAGTDLVQVQDNWFARNWRKLETETQYPRYSRVRTDFGGDCEALIQYLRDEKIGDFVPTQCEVSYVNHVGPLAHFNVHESLGRVIRLVAEVDESRLPTPEISRHATQYVLPGADGSAVGRLYVRAEPAFRRADDQPIIVLTLTARGAPMGEGLDGVLKFLDLGHEWASLALAEITTADVQQEWGRSQ